MAEADSGDISGSAEVLDANLLNKIVQADIGRVSLDPSGGDVGGPLVGLALSANDAGLLGLASVDLPLNSSTAYSDCTGQPDNDQVFAYCRSGVENLNLGLALKLLGIDALNIPIVHADVVKAAAASSGSEGFLTSSTGGSTIVGLRVGNTLYSDIAPGLSIPVNISVDTTQGITLNTAQALEGLGIERLGAGVDSLVNTVNALLFGQGEGLLSSVTNTLTVKATVGITGNVTVLGESIGGDGVTSTTASVTALSANLAVTINLDLGLSSDVTVAECEDVSSFPLLECTVGGLLGFLNDVLDGLIGQNGLLGGTLDGIFDELGLGFGDSGTVDRNALANVDIGVVSLSLVSAGSAVTNYQQPPVTPTPSDPPADPTSTPEPGTPTASATPGTPTATATPPTSTPPATSTPAPGMPAATPPAPTRTSTPGRGDPTVTQTPAPGDPWESATPTATPRPPATGSGTEGGGYDRTLAIAPGALLLLLATIGLVFQWKTRN